MSCVLRLFVALLDQLGVVDLLLRLEQCHTADLLEVHANRVVERHGVDRLGLGDELLIDLVDRLEVLVTVTDLDPHLAKDVEDPLQMIGLDIDLRECREDVVGREISVVLALDDQRLGGGDQQISARRRRQGGCSGSGGGGCCRHLNSCLTRRAHNNCGSRLRVPIRAIGEGENPRGHVQDGGSQVSGSNMRVRLRAKQISGPPGCGAGGGRRPRGG